MHQAYETLNSTGFGSGADRVTFQNRCLRTSPGMPCDSNSLLPLFNYSSADILAASDVVATINTALAAGYRNEVGRLMEVADVLGDVDTDSNGNVRLYGRVLIVGTSERHLHHIYIYIYVTS